MQMSQYGNQLKNYGIQLQNIASQIQNISMNVPMMGNEIQNMAYQISNIGYQIFNIGMNFINQKSIMNIMSNQFLYMNNIQEPNFSNNNKMKINVFFKDDCLGKLNRTLFVPVDMSVEELLKLYLKNINRNPNDNEIYFLFNGKIINNYKIKIEELGLIDGSQILVSKKQQVIAAS